MGIQSISHWLVRNRLFVISLVCLGVGLAAFAGPAGAVTPQIAATEWNSMTLNTDGTLWVWGTNSHGLLGTGKYDNDIHPVPVQVGTDTDWVTVAAGFGHSLGLKADGTLWIWGWKNFGQLG